MTPHQMKLLVKQQERRKIRVEMTMGDLLDICSSLSHCARPSHARMEQKRKNLRKLAHRLSDYWRRKYGR